METFVVRLITWWSAILGAPPMNKAYTFFSGKDVGWNMANHICSEAGMSIVSPFTREEYEELHKLSKSTEWRKKGKWDGRGPQNVWTAVRSSPRGTLFWGNCSKFESSEKPWLDIVSDSDNICLLVEIKIIDAPKWRFETCDKAEKVVCENITGPCAYISQVDTVIEPSIPHDVLLSTTNTTCEELCRFAEHEGKHCWAYRYNNNNATCSIYYANSREDIIAALQAGDGAQVQLKTCSYEGFSNETDVGIDLYKQVKHPLINCSALTTSTALVPVTTEAVPSSNSAELENEKATSTATVSVLPTSENGQTGGGLLGTTQTAQRTSTSSTSLTTLVIEQKTTLVTKVMSTFGRKISPGSLPTAAATSDTVLVTHPIPKRTTTISSTTTSIPLTTETQTEDQETHSFSIPSSTYVNKDFGQDVSTEKGAVSEAPSHPCPPCRCSADNHTVEEKVAFTNALLKELTINTSQTSSSRRKKVSAPDQRRSAVGIGVLGGVFLALPFVFIVSTDTVAVIARLQSLWAEKA